MALPALGNCIRRHIKDPLGHLAAFGHRRRQAGITYEPADRAGDTAEFAGRSGSRRQGVTEVAHRLRQARNVLLFHPGCRTRVAYEPTSGSVLLRRGPHAVTGRKRNR